MSDQNDGNNLVNLQQKPTYEQLEQEIARIQTVLVTRGIEDVSRMSDALTWATRAALLGDPNAKATLQRWISAQQSAVSAASGIIRPT